MKSNLHVCYICAGARGGLKRVSDSLKLELQVGVSHPVWMLGGKPVSSGRAVSAPPLNLLSSPEFDFLLINTESTALHKYMVQVYLGLFQKLLAILF